MSFDEELDDCTGSLLNLDEEEAKEFRQAVMNLVYEDLFKPLWQRHEEFVRKTKRTYFILIRLQVILIALLLRSWLW